MRPIKWRLSAGCLVAVLLGCLIFEPSAALAENSAGEVARDAFGEFQRQAPEMSLAGNAPRAAPMLAAHATFWRCTDGETSLTIDLRGNASYARVAGWSPGAAGGNASSRPADNNALVRKTRELATPWLSADTTRSTKAVLKRETLLLAELPAGALAEVPGRTIVRLTGPNDIGEGSFQAVFDPEGRLLRFDIAFANARTKDLCNRGLLAKMDAVKPSAKVGPLTLGCFFDPSEYRFEISAFSVEGEPFLDLKQSSNPFTHDHFDLKHADRVSVERYRKSQDYHWWCWAWWQHYGCVGGFRGNSLEGEGQARWEFADHQLLHHRSLASYQTVQGPPRKTKTIQQSDGPIAYPFAAGQTFKPSFYRDLEQCHVAWIFTHGGPIQGAYQIRRGLDVWVKLAPPGRKLGVGKLRHLFLDGCAAFTYRREPQSAHLLKTWIRQTPANGLCTVCGVDGEASLLDRSGWRFFGHYNKGESVSDAWAFAMLDEFVGNSPATAAYGRTTGEAVETLLRGRFTDEKAASKAVAISIWSAPVTP